MNMLMRVTLAEEDELQIAQKYFHVYTNRTHIPYQIIESTVVGRYSTLPYYEELYADLAHNNSFLINNVEQHKYIANADWIKDVQKYTPKTWYDHNIREAPKDIKFVVKGTTNSRKLQWKELMFAQNRSHALEIGAKLKGDSLIQTQDILYREYVPLEVLEHEIESSCPITNEWRFFCYKDRLLSCGFYWNVAQKETIAKADLDFNAFLLLDKCIKIIGQKTNFYTLDLAKTIAGNWILIEVNDGQQSGLSCNDPDTMYSKLRRAMNDSSI